MKTSNLEDLAESLAAVFVGGVLAMHPDAGPIVVGVAAGLPMAARRVLGLAGRYADQNDEALRISRQESTQAWLIQWTTELRHVIEAQRKLAERFDEFDVRFAERVDDREFQRVIDNFGVEATREARDDRRGMIAHATANAFNLSLTVAQAARAERTLRELDPEDVIALQDFRPGERDAASQYATAGLETLLAAGCLLANWGTPPGMASGAVVRYSMTPTGGLVLRLLGSYKQPDTSAT